MFSVPIPASQLVQKLLNLGRQYPKIFEKKPVKFYNYLGSQFFYINNDKYIGCRYK